MANLVSVVIPTYNRADLLPLTIASVLNQTYSNIEILVVDDGSTDNTKDVVSSIPDRRIRFFQISHAGYPAPARNKGIQEAKGEYIAMLDSDDLWKPSKISRQIRAFEDDPHLRLVSTNFTNYPRSTGPILKLNADKIVSFRNIFIRNAIMNSSAMFKKEVVSKIGLLDEGYAFKSVEDVDYWLRILKVFDYSAKILKDPLTLYRVHDKNMSEISDFLGPVIEFKRFLNVAKKFQYTDSQFVEKVIMNRANFIRYYIVRHRIEIGSFCILHLLTNKTIVPYFKMRAFAYFLLRQIERRAPLFLRSQIRNLISVL